MMILDSKHVEQARSADMLAFLEKRSGFTFARQGSVYRCREHPSLAIKDDRLSWYWHSQGVGGHSAIDYLMKMERLPFRQAVEAVEGITTVAVQPQQEMEQIKALILPERRGLSFRLYDYLCCKRGIDREIVDTLMQEGKLYEDKRGNVVFVGFDEQGKARFASLRGTFGEQKFRMDCSGSDKQYGFCMDGLPSGLLYIFESPIDAMSHASLENILAGDQDAWWRNHRLSLAGTSDIALPQWLKDHPRIKELVLCLDNDDAGREAAVSIARKYLGLGYVTRLELPRGKDYSEDLMVQRAEMRQVKPRQNRICQEAR